MKVRAFVLAASLLLSGSFATMAHAQAASRSVMGPIWVEMTTSPTALEWSSFKAPANGNLIITVTGTVNYEHTQGTAGNWCLQLSNVAANVGGCVPDAGSDSAIRDYIAAAVVTTTPGFGTSAPYSIVRSYPVVAGATYTIFLNGYQSGLNNTWLFQPSMTALFAQDSLLP